MAAEEKATNAEEKEAPSAPAEPATSKEPPKKKVRFTGKTKAPAMHQPALPPTPQPNPASPKGEGGHGEGAGEGDESSSEDLFADMNMESDLASEFLSMSGDDDMLDYYTTV